MNTHDPRDSYIAQVVQGRSFLEVGGLWGGVNEKVSVAYRFGARRLAIVDVAKPENQWWEFFRQRMTQMDIKNYDAYAEDICTVDSVRIGAPFDVVHCSGVLYNLPDPMRLLAVLRSITIEFCILTSVVIPEVIENEVSCYKLPPSAMVFVPALTDRERDCLKAYWRQFLGNSVAYGITDVASFSVDDFAPWWWLPTATALKAMCRSAGFQVVDSQPCWNNGALTLLLR
ncbi:MAG: hypothetical protein QW328_08945 [Nitrososphaerota archaeon]